MRKDEHSFVVSETDLKRGHSDQKHTDIKQINEEKANNYDISDWSEGPLIKLPPKARESNHVINMLVSEEEKEEPNDKTKAEEMILSELGSNDEGFGPLEDILIP